MATQYAVVFENVTPGTKVTFGCTGKAQRFYLDDVVVTTGDDRDPVEMGEDATENLVIPGITSTSYNVTGLNTGATYRFLVVTRFADQVTKKSNLQLVTLTAQEEHNYTAGDVNHDSAIDIRDVVVLIDCLLSGFNENTCAICADVNGDADVNIRDVTRLIDILLSTESPQ